MAVWNVHASDSLSLPANSVTWSSIPTTYDHLYITASARNDQTGAAVNADVEVRLGNGSIDTGSNYGFTSVYTAGTWPATYSSTGDSLQYIWNVRNTANATVWGQIGIWIPFYQSSNWKTVIVDAAAPEQSTSVGEYAAQAYAGRWESTAVVDTVSILLMTGSADFVANSKFTLYGITGAV
jgi:hypothetical protein